MNPFLTSVGCNLERINETNDDFDGSRTLTFRQSSSWDDPSTTSCLDNESFRDVRGLGCATWNLRDHDCTDIEIRYGYTSSEADAVRSACPVACGSCGSVLLIHSVGIPDSYKKHNGGPYPVFLYFHGWGGDESECGNVCDYAREKGFVTIAMRGMGPTFWASWNGFGSTQSPGADGPICDVTTSQNLCYADCGASCQPCWWTTCRDSVEQVKQVVRSLSSALCLDHKNVFASGCSNGGMFLHELAHDPEFSLRTIAPVVGLPHNGTSILIHLYPSFYTYTSTYKTSPSPPKKHIHIYITGFNFGPLKKSTTRYIGFYGDTDTTVPPLSNTNDPTKSFDTANLGWYYSTARNTTSVWASSNGCNEVNAPTQDFSVGHDEVTCLQYSDCDRAVVECIFQGGHICNRRWQFEPIIDFMLEDLDGSSSSSSNITMFILLPLGGLMMVMIFAVLTYPRLRDSKTTFARLDEDKGAEMAPISNSHTKHEKKKERQDDLVYNEVDGVEI